MLEHLLYQQALQRKHNRQFFLKTCVYLLFQHSGNKKKIKQLKDKRKKKGTGGLMFFIIWTIHNIIIQV